MSQERELIGRAWRRIWLQTSVVMALAVVAVAGTAAGLAQRARHDAAHRTLDAAVTRAAQSGVAATPPSGVWVYILDGAAITHSAGAVERPLSLADLTAVAAGAPGRTQEVHEGGGEFLVSTRRSGRVTIQVALDLSGQDEEGDRLLFALGAAAVVGLALAVAAGAIIARRAIRPLGLAIDRQQRFVADASHELRTPITQLHVRAQLLARALAQTDEHSEAADDARQLVRGTRQMGDVVEELLLAAQLRAEPDQFGAVDLTGLVTEVVEADAGRARERGIALDLAAPAQPCVVRGVPAALRRVVSSLVDNALGHTQATGTVLVTLRHEARHVDCVVSDDGVGFDPADADRIFERFARGTHGEGRRFGLGLALVREVVEAHGGAVWATGEPGRGAVFTVRLPRWEGSAGR